MELDDALISRLEELERKYSAMGQDMNSYLDGLIHADFLTYWDYIHLDTLLSLQNPKTDIPDEEIFILYHQITELYFKLIIKAIDQLISEVSPSVEFMSRQMERVNSYFSQLIGSFGVMIKGMDRKEFLKFRMSLLPASGFQSAQYRMIEIRSTDLSQLLHHTKRDSIAKNATIEEQYEALYWKSGATELATGKKTLTLRQFEKKYSEKFIRLSQRLISSNLRQFVLKNMDKIEENPELRTLFREHDLNANVRWPLEHFKSAVQYLDRKPDIIAATGGTNWQKYLPPKNQRVIFYPELWSNEELDSWGKVGFN